jgi:hypothetical protein
LLSGATLVANPFRDVIGDLGELGRARVTEFFLAARLTDRAFRARLALAVCAAAVCVVAIAVVWPRTRLIGTAQNAPMSATNAAELTFDFRDKGCLTSSNIVILRCRTRKWEETPGEQSANRAYCRVPSLRRSRP